MEQKDEIIRVPVKRIREGFNYRRRYNQAALDSLAEDIKRNGLIYPPVVRKVEGEEDYQLLAGGRRYKAYIAAFGEEAEIPTIVKVLTDVEATALMMAENQERENPSVIEDAEGAARMLGLCNGNRDEAAARLGWDRKKFDRRLALMNATQMVRDAYLEDLIGVGHVEILAAFRKEVQDRIIEKCRSGEAKWPSLEQLKAMGQQALCSLEKAIFSRSECNGCRHNTGYQQAMFDNAFEGSHCSNKECYDKKTNAELEVRKARLEEDYQVVRIVRPGENFTVIPLRADGERGVGEEQAKACRTCADFGACVSAVPDKLGNAYRDVCFNKACNDSKVEAYRKQHQAQQQAPSESESTTEGGTAKAPDPAAAAQKPAAGKATASPKAETNKLRNAIVEYREQIWRKIFQRAALKLDVIPSRQLLAALILERPAWLAHHETTAVLKQSAGIEVGTHSGLGKALKQTLSFDQKQLAAVFTNAAAHISKDVPISDVVGMLKALNVRIEDWWKVNETFFDILTKVELDAVCEEIGLAKAAGKTYASLKNGSKKDFVAAMLKVEGFKYDGAVPKMMRWD